MFNFNISKYFGRRSEAINESESIIENNNTNEAPLNGDEDYSEKLEDKPIDLNPQTPPIKTFNKKFIYGIVAAAAGVFTYSFMYGLGPREPTTPIQGNTVPTAVASSHLDKIPSSYSENGQKKQPQVIVNGVDPNQQNRVVQPHYGSQTSQPPVPVRPYYSSTAGYNPYSYQQPSGPPIISAPNTTSSNYVSERNDPAKSPISFAIKAVEAAVKQVTASESTATAQAVADNTQIDGKIAFLNRNNSESFYQATSLQSPLSPYQLMAGTVIPSVMISGINSDLPGQVVGQVSQNVYDSVTGQYLLIPQGTKVIGVYDNQVSYGQERVLIVWHRLIFPNGMFIGLENMEGVDMSGYAGFHDKVNNHNGRIFSSVVLGSLLSAAATVSTANDASDDSFGAAAGSGIAQNIANSAQALLAKNLNIQPTLIIQPGYQFNIFLTKDMILKPYDSL